MTAALCTTTMDSGLHRNDAWRKEVQENHLLPG
jgi:hypothetical protein